jgi:hypothetical protein
MIAFDLIRQAVNEELELRRAEIEQDDTNWFSIKIFLAKDGTGLTQSTFQSERKRDLGRRHREWRNRG